jgi:iron complex outermembrane receptor protein
MSRSICAIRSRPSLLRLSALTAALVLALPALARAQDESPPPGEGGDTTALDVISVTAQRRVEDAQDVPIAITTVADEKLDILGSGGEDIRFLSGRLPSLLIESSFGRAFPRFYIRGLGNTDFDLNASQPVSLVYDEVVQENPILKGFPVFDLDQIEMLRGPQGTLFGRNTPAGVIKFESRKPEQESSGYAQVSYGKYSTLNFEGAVGGALNPAWSARIAGMGQHRDDWVDNAFTGESDALEGYDEYAARLQLLYDGGNDFTGLFNLHARSLEGTARLFRANLLAPGTNQIAGHFDRNEVAIDGDNSQELDTLGGSARLSWDWGRVTMHSVTGYESVDTLSRGDIDGGFGAVFAPPFGPGFIPFTAESADGMPDHSQFTQEFRWESNEWGALDWQAGLFYFDEDLTIETFNYDTLAPGRPQNGYVVQEQDTQAWAAFGSIEYEVSDDFTLRGGLRYTNDSKEFVAERLQSPLSFLGVGPIGPIFADTDDSDVSWDLSGTWELSDTTNVFARVARGFRAPNIQGRLLFGDVVSVADSETAISYEAGIKAEFWDRRARTSFTLFRYEVDDQQLTAVGGGTNFNTAINADRAQGQGFEFDLEAYLTDQFLVTFGASYNDTEIDDEDLAVQVCGASNGAPPLCTVRDPTVVVGGSTLALVDGNALPNAPEWIANVTARYGIPMGPDGGELFFYTDWAYRGEVSFFIYDSEEFRGDPLLEGGLRVGFNWEYGKYELALFGRNILDETDVVGGIDFNNLTGFVNEPRIWGLEFKAEF